MVLAPPQSSVAPVSILGLHVLVLRNFAPRVDFRDKGPSTAGFGLLAHVGDGNHCGLSCGLGCGHRHTNCFALSTDARDAGGGDSISLEGMISAVCAATLAAFLVITQWLVLRRQVSRTGWCVMGITAALAVAVGIGMGANPPVVGTTFFLPYYVYAGALVGAATATLQWLVLRHHMPGAGWWVLASSWGLAVGGGLTYALNLGPDVGELHAAVVGGAVTGASLGAIQWLVLRQFVSRAGWWVFTNSIALAAGFAFVAYGDMWMGLVAGLVTGAITGLALAWLLQRRVPGT